MGTADFCLVESILPSGPWQPFATVMLKHFEKQKTTLASAQKYPTLATQEQRFLKAGWISAQVRTLWDIWADDTFISSVERVRLDTIEPFDEVSDVFLWTSPRFATNLGKHPSR